MRFFIPSANDPGHAEELYCKIRDQVAASQGSVIDKRIYRLKYQDEGGPATVVVGSDRHRFGAGPVLAIFEGADGTHYICTQKAAVSEAEPHALPSSAVVDAEAFSALG